MNNKPSKRCINLDWLEVHALEPITIPHDAIYFARAGWHVEVREYGTRVYSEMFTLYGTDDQPFLEVRRAPMSTGLKGIFSPNECHLRLTNRSCYFDDAARRLADFMRTYDYEFRRVVRADICFDFEYFDSGDKPQAFLTRYVKGVYSKINQANIHAHGEDRWSGRQWNSISWGSPASDIGTKMYDKTKELYDPKTSSYKKPYIRQAWFLAGLVDDPTKVSKRAEDDTTYTPSIWRIEFSIRSSVRNWFVIRPDGSETKLRSIRNDLSVYDGREKLMTIFAALTRHYFRFKYYEEGKRKDLCKDKELFRWSGEQLFYKVDKTTLAGVGTEFRPLDSLLNKLRAYRQQNMWNEEIARAANVLIDALESDVYRTDLQNPWSREELKALQLLMARRSRGEEEATYQAVLKEVQALMNLSKDLMPFN